MRKGFMKRVARIIEKSDLSYEEMEAKAGVPRSCIYKWAKEGVTPRSDAYFKFCEVLKVDPVKLWYGRKKDLTKGKKNVTVRRAKA